MADHDAAGRGLQHRIEEAPPDHLDEHARQGPRVRHVTRAQHRDHRQPCLSRSRHPGSLVDGRQAAERRHAGGRVRGALSRRNDRSGAAVALVAAVPRTALSPADHMAESPAARARHARCCSSSDLVRVRLHESTPDTAPSSLRVPRCSRSSGAEITERAHRTGGGPSRERTFFGVTTGRNGAVLFLRLATHLVQRLASAPAPSLRAAHPSDPRTSVRSPADRRRRLAVMPVVRDVLVRFCCPVFTEPWRRWRGFRFQRSAPPSSRRS